MQTPKQAPEPLIVQALKVTAEILRQQADIIDALALASAGGNNEDALKPSEVAQYLNCSATKARSIVHEFGEGKGRMIRIRRGVLEQKRKEGRI